MADDFTDILWADSQDNPGGTQTKLFYIPLAEIANYPKLPQAPSDLSDLVGFRDPIVPLPGKKFHELYVTMDTAEVKSDSVGDIDGKSYKISVDFYHPGSNGKALGFKRKVNNSNMVFLVPEVDGTVKVIGSPQFPAKVSTGDHTSGKATEDRRGLNMMLTSKGVTPAIIYDNHIQATPMLDFGNGLQLNGGTEYVRVIPNGEPLFDQGSFTIEIWVKPLAPFNVLKPLFDFDQMKLEITSTDQISLKWHDAGGGNQVLTSVATVTQNDWNHIVARVKPNLQTIWLNGIEIATSAHLDPADQDAQSVFIGKQDGTYAVAVFDEFRFYDRYIEDQEVNRSYFSGYGNEPSDNSGLVCRYKMNEAAGIVLADETANSIDGDLLNAPGDPTNWVAH